MLLDFGLEEELAEVERRLLLHVESEEPLLEEMARHVIEAGGKRIRPTAAVLAYLTCGGGKARRDDILEIAVGLELIHSATLIHDDINDGAESRRGRPTVHRKYGRAKAIVAGDFLFTKGFQISGRFDERVVDWTAEACTKLAEGEVLQARRLGDPTIPLDEYFTLIRRKTAYFMQAGVRIGAYLAGARDDQIEALSRYGLELGTAFQIVDDVLDVSGQGAVTGKDAGADLREGNTTLPAILTIAKGGKDAEVLKAILREGGANGHVDEALRIIRGSGAIEESMRMARECGERAKKVLGPIPDSPYRRKLSRLVDVVLGREL